MKNIVTNAYIFKDRGAKTRLFGEVVEDERYEKGHHIVTSEINLVDEEKDIVITESGTKYNVLKFLNKEEFISHIKENYGEEKVEYYMFYTNIQI